MKADTFAKLVVLDALVEAEIGYFIEHRPSSLELFREAMVSRISDLVDEIDVLDSAAAARVYDAIVDFLADLPEEGGAVVTATIRFRRALDRIIARGMDRSDKAAAETWAIVLDELLAELGDEYRLAFPGSGGVRMREYARVESLLDRIRQAADRMLWNSDDDLHIANNIDRLVFAVGYERVPPSAAEATIRTIQRRSARYRPSTLTRVGSFVLRQVLRRNPVQSAKKTGRAGRQRGRSRRAH